jgi:cytochrome c553
MIDRIIGVKLVVTLSLFSGVLVVADSSGGQARTKKQNMVEMGEQFAALNQKMMAGAVTSKFSEQDFQQIEAYCDSLARLANEYAGLESDKDLAAISTTMAASVNYLKQQVTGKDSLIVVMSYGRTMSFCAECHYQTRWKESPAKPQAAKEE